MELYGRVLRHAILALLLSTRRPMSIESILRALESGGDYVGGAYPRKVLADALGHEVTRGRVLRVRRGWYRSGRVPKTTTWRAGRWRERARLGELHP